MLRPPNVAQFQVDSLEHRFESLSARSFRRFYVQGAISLCIWIPAKRVRHLFPYWNLALGGSKKGWLELARMRKAKTTAQHQVVLSSTSCLHSCKDRSLSLHDGIEHEIY